MRIEIYLKGPGQPPPFSMPWKLFILHGEVKSECFTIGCVPECTFNYLKFSTFTVISFVSTSSE